MTTLEKNGRASPYRAVFRFLCGHWRRRPALVAAIAASMIAATLGDVAMPVFAGKLIDAASREPAEAGALRAAIVALASMAGLGAGVLVLRQLAFFGIIRLTLATMTEIAQEPFWRVQRFSTDWHANTFAGSTVRKISRGMWALDLLNDTALIALLPSLVVLLGSTLLLAWYWPILGAAIAIGSVVY